MTATPVNDDFVRLADPFRRELLAHCYRMLGSIHEAEDLVQETYMRAWRSYESFEGRSSVRTWLYRIATNACLTELEKHGKRPLPTGLGSSSSEPDGVLEQQPDVAWLEPFPSSPGDATRTDPADVVTSRESTRLALIAALQHLPHRQRAVLILRDVLKWRAAEVAELLETTTAAVNSMLQRARAQIDEVMPSQQSRAEPLSREQRELLERYVTAFERKDIAAIVALFTEDAVWEMPPFTGWFQGPETIGRLVANQCPAGPDDMRLLATEANDQPAFAVYMRDPEEHDVFRPFQLHVLSLDGAAITHVASFFDPRLFETFGLPETYPARSRSLA